MAKPSQHAETTKTQPQASSEFPDLMQIGPVMIFKASMAYWQVLLDWQQETLRFLSHRLQKDARLDDALAHSGSFLDLIKVQQDWAASALKEYVTESGKLFSMVNREILPKTADVVSKAAE